MICEAKLIREPSPEERQLEQDTDAARSIMDEMGKVVVEFLERCNRDGKVTDETQALSVVMDELTRQAEEISDSRLQTSTRLVVYSARLLMLGREIYHVAGDDRMANLAMEKYKIDYVHFVRDLAVKMGELEHNEC